jgi:DNA polymerase I-like protein with 3'-5' exonuclease and polymerase domains|nr:MAG TPA: Prex DNA polymerase [Caudoviricetes sp.]
MIYLVSHNKSLFQTDKYVEATMKQAMSVLLPLKLCQLDTETKGLDCHTKALLTIQLGNKDNQVVIDWTTLTPREKQIVKNYLESDRLFLGWNLMFDLTFLYVQGIYPKHIWDGMIAEQLLYLGYPAQMREKSLKAAAWNYLNINIDKTVRGKIVNDGLTTEVVIYAAGDVTYIEDIKEKQDIEIEKQGMKLAVELECEFVKSLAYFKYCGVHLDITKWKAKMTKDQAKLDKAISELNAWVVAWDKENPHNGYDIQYPELKYPKYSADYPAEVKRLIKDGYKRFPQEDLQTPDGKVDAYKKVIKNQFTRIDTQGDLFTGFDTEPKCVINWSSQKQVIPLFELLGINVETFDKKTKQKKKSIEANVLKPQKNDFPIIPIFLEYQEAAKVVSTYGQNWLNAINPKTGRIHADFHSIGTDTARVSSGGGVWKLNMQNLPHDPETRACFTSEEGNAWLSADYQSQESRIIASVSKDEKMIDLFEHGCGDVHSLVAYMSYPNIIPRDTKIEDIKKLYHNWRQKAKSIEFAINYGGDYNTISKNDGIPVEEAKEIYDNFMEGFPGIKRYQDYCRAAVMRDGYILLNPLTGHRAHIYDAEELKETHNKMQEPGFWEYYQNVRKRNPQDEIVQEVRHYMQRKAASEKQSINYRIQNRGAMCFKLSSIKLFNWIVDHKLIDKVKMCVPAHDEFNLECPAAIKEQVGKVLIDCMIAGGKPFCPNVFLGADIDINDHWVH